MKPFVLVLLAFAVVWAVGLTQRTFYLWGMGTKVNSHVPLCPAFLKRDGIDDGQQNVNLTVGQVVNVKRNNKVV
jgi:hypothetical protein